MATTETGFAVGTIDDIEQGAVSSGRVRHRVRDHFGIEGFGVNVNRAVEAGGEIINEHSEEAGVSSNGQEELYVVLSGHATFTVDGDEVDAPVGTLVFVKPGVRRSAVAEQDTSVLIVGGTPGEAYNQTAGWLVSPMFGPYQEGDYAGAKAKLTEVLAEHPGIPLALFNLACMESLLGEKDEALGHLAEAIAAEPGFKGLARDDDDFKPLHDEPRYRELVA